jgi:hypothetical protein
MSQGDHIYVNRAPIDHHGIDCGDGTVIHFSKKNGEGRICRDSIHSFARGSSIYVKPRKHHYSPEEIVQRAKSKLGETGYNLGFNNCEHFASWCHSGRHHSKQVANVVEPLATGGLSFALGAIPLIETTVAAPGILGMLGMTTTSVVGLGVLPVAAVLGGAYLGYKLLSDDD